MKLKLNLHSTIFILIQDIENTLEGETYVFTFYYIYINTKSWNPCCPALSKLTFYYIYINTENEESEETSETEFTFYYIYINTIYMM